MLELPPRLVPLFPIGPFTPGAKCGHKRPIRPGSAFVCMVCHQSGLDHIPSFQRDPRTDPGRRRRPRHSEAARSCDRAGSGKPLHPETRRQRRRRLFGDPAGDPRKAA